MSGSSSVPPHTASAHYYSAADLGRFPEIARGSKPLADKFFDWYNAVFADGALTTREKSLDRARRRTRGAVSVLYQRV